MGPHSNSADAGHHRNDDWNPLADLKLEFVLLGLITAATGTFLGFFLEFKTTDSALR
jgi:uncharacterized protein involved in propanediol utilization